MQIYRILPLIATLFTSTWLLVSCAQTSTPAPGSEPELEAHVEVDTPPVPLNMADIQREIGYPKDAREQGIQGMVVLRILVGTDGTYIRHELVNQADESLVQAVEAKVASLMFTPAQSDGSPVKFWVNVPFGFKITE